MNLKNLQPHSKISSGSDHLGAILPPTASTQDRAQTLLSQAREAFPALSEQTRGAFGPAIECVNIAPPNAKPDTVRALYTKYLDSPIQTDQVTTQHYNELVGVLGARLKAFSEVREVFEAVEEERETRLGAGQGNGWLEEARDRFDKKYSEASNDLIHLVSGR